MDRYGPCCSRQLIIRAANAGPTRGRRSSSACVARFTSTSSGVRAGGLHAEILDTWSAELESEVCVAGRTGRPRVGRAGRRALVARALVARAESTADICADKARSPTDSLDAPPTRCCAPLSSRVNRFAPTARTPPPITATAERNRRAWRSAVVGIAQNTADLSDHCHQFVAGPAPLLHVIRARPARSKPNTVQLCGF